MKCLHFSEQEGEDMLGSPSKAQHFPYISPNGSPSHSPYCMDNPDLRPREDYDTPWGWGSSNQNNMVFNKEDQPSTSNQNCTPLMTPKRTNCNVNGEREAVSNGEEGSGVVQEEGKSSGDKHSKDYEQAQTTEEDKEEEEEEEGYMHLNEELANKAAAEVTTTDNNPSAGPDVRPKHQPRAGNYEEPWDLSVTQKELEQKFRAVSMSEQEQLASSDQAQAGSAAASPGPGPHQTDTRPQEGYEKPWDWKPDRKDDRPLEGYEKPWDWRPEQKDDRPGEEYEQPWDQKVKDIERDLVHAKSAKNAAAASSANGVGGGKADDTRPSDEYEEPWDQKAKNKLTASRTGKNRKTASLVDHL